MNFPAEVTVSQLRAFLRLVCGSEETTHVHTVASELHMNLTRLLPILDAAEILGLVTVEKGEIKRTKDGNNACMRWESVPVMGGALSKVEPFTTALKFEKKFSGEDVAKKLSHKGIRWHHENELNSLIVGEILIRWGIRSGLFDYDGSVFTRKIRPDGSS